LANFSTNRSYPVSVYPTSASDGNEFTRVEPLINPRQLIQRHLMGLSMFSASINPLTGKRDEFTEEILKDYILRAVSDTELEIGITIFPTEFDEKYPFDKEFWRNFCNIQTNHRPVLSIEDLAFTPASGQDIFQLNPEWIESANFYRGIINIIPLVPAAAAQFVQSTTGSTGNAYLTFLGGLSWIPAIIRVKYTCGFTNGAMPRILNEVIGINAALEVLGSLAATNRNTSTSLGADSLNQSYSNPGPQVYNERMKYLQGKKESFVRKIRSLYGLNIISNYI
jgi:hypothetical protein